MTSSRMEVRLCLTALAMARVRATSGSSCMGVDMGGVWVVVVFDGVDASRRRMVKGEGEGKGIGMARGCGSTGIRGEDVVPVKCHGTECLLPDCGESRAVVVPPPFPPPQKAGAYAPRAGSRTGQPLWHLHHHHPSPGPHLRLIVAGPASRRAPRLGARHHFKWGVK